MNGRILLIQAPEYLIGKKTIPTEDFLGLSYPPLGLAYIAAMLLENGWQTKIIDPVPQNLSSPQILVEIKKFAPDFIGLTATTPTFPKALTLAKKIKRKFPQIVTIIGGPHVTAAPIQTMKNPFFDFAVLGEGEETIIELLSHLKRKKEGDEKIPGIAFKKNGKVIIAASRPYIKNLDKIPFPARKLLPPLSFYHPNPGTYKNLPAASMITSRGCPFKCTFCDRAVFGNQVRFRSPKNVVDEIEMLVKEYGAREIRVWDDIFNLDPNRVIEICKEILKRKLIFSWTCLARVNFVNLRMLRWMKKAGCWQISYGIESGNQEILNKIKKGLTLEMVREVVKKTHQAGIEVKGFFMLGLPGDTKKTIQQTINFAKSLDIDIATFSITTPFPGTEIYQEVKNIPQFKRVDFSHYLPYYPTSLSYVPAGLNQKTLLEFEKKAHFEFYLRPRYIFRELVKIRSFFDFWSKTKAFLRLLKHWI